MDIYKPQHSIRIITSASLFDGHDAAINIMRRILQASGAEVIHLGHNRSVAEIAQAAIQEDVNAIALTSYQGGHMEFFKYLYDILKEKGAGHIKIFGGGGGTILPTEIEELHQYGIARIYSPDDGRAMSLQGMINDLLQQADFPIQATHANTFNSIQATNSLSLAQCISAVELDTIDANQLENLSKSTGVTSPKILGITGTGGAGKSSLVDELILRYRFNYPDKKVAIVSVDPTKRRTGGALLGDRIRMNAIYGDNVFMRSMATRQQHLAVSKHIPQVLQLLSAAQFDLIILETAGIGQSDSAVTDLVDYSMYVMTPEYGAATQLEKIDMLDFAQVIALNKSDKKGAEDALRAIQKQYQRNHLLWEDDLDKMPVFATMAGTFNDKGVTELFDFVMDQLGKSIPSVTKSSVHESSVPNYIIPPKRVRYLSEIAESIRAYNQEVNQQATYSNQLYSLENTKEQLQQADVTESITAIDDRIEAVKQSITVANLELITQWEELKAAYAKPTFTYKVRGKAIEVDTQSTSLSQLSIPKITLPRYAAWGDTLRWQLQENVPGSFPFTAGVFPFKRKGEDPTRMFAGEGGPERTNKRFHYVSRNSDAKRLSTAFDSVTLYGEDPAHRPDIYGKIGNAGVSICCLDDMKKLYSGFDLSSSATSVSMTINGPAAILTAYFLHAAIDQACEQYIHQHGLLESTQQKIKERYTQLGKAVPTYLGALPEGNNGLGTLLLGISGKDVLPAAVYEEIRANTIQAVRGTVQADILKEDQAQNTCIFSTEFSLQLMGDMQQYFINHKIRNFYSVSISGYHMAEAGANPISQLAFTLSNGFTYLEYYASRGMDIDAFAPNFSFFFSNGIDPEYAVIGRVARRIWAKALKLKYGSNERAQKLKYHIQTSGRSLHAQEIDFNDIRTTLQALYAIYDNCNSLHTNAYDEAITTPTEDSVRRAMAIQLIINHELGLAKNENPLQGSFIIEELTDLVEEAVLVEFDKITDRGGVLGAMETMYQRSKIQEESLYYEHKKHSGELPIMGVNTFLSSKGSPTVIPSEVIRAEEEEKQEQIETINRLHQTYPQEQAAAITQLKEAAQQHANVFDVLMDVVPYCSLGQITHALYEVGGQYRRNM